MLVEGQAGEEPVLLNIEGDDVGKRETADCWKHTYLPINNMIGVDAGDTIFAFFFPNLRAGSRTV